MARYIVRRLLWSFALLVIVSAVVFMIFYVFPSADPAQLRAGRQANADQIAAIRESLGLDKSVLEQFWIYIKGVFTPLDLPGHRRARAALLRPQLPVQRRRQGRDHRPTCRRPVLLVIGAVILWLAIAIPVGIISAVKQPLAARPGDDDHDASPSSRRRSSGSASSRSTCSPRTSG